MAVDQMRMPIEDVQSGDILPEPAGLATPAVRGDPEVHKRPEGACEAAFNAGRFAVKVARYRDQILSRIRVMELVNGLRGGEEKQKKKVSPRDPPPEEADNSPESAFTVTTKKNQKK